MPFLQRSRAGVKIVPILFMLRNVEDILEAGQAIGSVLKGWHERVLIVASSDMTHYESAEAARKKDELAIEKVLDLDPQGLLATTAGHHISMCGVVPTAIMLEAAKQLGATSARQIAYAHSGEASGDFSSVVGYAGILVA